MQSGDLSSQHVDILQEVGNIGAAHAATALSELLGAPVRISVSNARRCTFDEVTEVAGGPDELTVGVFVRVTGDIGGNMLLLMSVASANMLLRTLLGSEDADGNYDEMQLSAIGEVGNILGGAYTSAIASLTSLHISQSVPAVAVDMAGAILDAGILATSEVSDFAVLIDTSIMGGQSNIDGHFFLLPDPSSTAPLLDALGC
ncbi:chemotaxis protein CheC [Alicyclobacillus curvatus]|jgi:chemotaxis protein CheC|nr:chemotaxis protein CheC [Alicyclobacillus curvatus]